MDPQSLRHIVLLVPAALHPLLQSRAVPLVLAALPELESSGIELYLEALQIIVV